ncbi:hypothetical protein EWM64_g10460 [Hericium alpestre]|uniref:NADP-dependent oxidoreductase domain-containing protein n=1 Tax=Hericium alpestre TaxID=135208 RepID=A0A4Y9ZG48_9AGAM|nr:hypothetical protein EWM64_g10460 [Hericium alpestre]
MVVALKRRPTPDAEAFEAVKAGLDQLPEGVKMLLNSGRFNDRPFKASSRQFVENARRCVDLVLEKLRGTKKIDHYEFGRILAGDSVEDNMRTLAALKAEGKFDHIGLSDCRAETVRRANAKRLFTYYPDQSEKQLRIRSVTIYVASGLNTVFIPSLTVKDNTITAVLEEVAKKNNISQAQARIAWVASRDPHVIPLPGSSHKIRTLENLAAGDIVLPAEDIAKIDKVVLAHSDENARRIDDPHSNDA